MLRKQIDRYVGGSFVAFFTGSACLMGVLYVVFDLLRRLDQIRDLGLRTGAATLAAYYGHLLPVFLADIAPGVCLIAAGMVLVKMAKRRELLALKASGTSIHRATAPIFAWALLISIAAFAVRETVGPAFTRQRAILDNVLEGKVERHLWPTEAAAERQVFVGQYDFSTDTLKDVTMLELHPNGAPRREIYAPTAVLQRDGSLLLQGGEVQEFDASGSTARTHPLGEQVVATGLTRFDFVSAAEEQDGGSAVRTLPALLQGMRDYPAVPYFRVAFHSRLAAFFSPLLLLLVGIPCLVGFERSVDSLFLGVIVSIVVATGYYAVTFVLGSMGISDTLNAMLAGWLPVTIVGSLGLWLFESMLT
jgi:lipopolysaccharide export system permease protein